MTRLVIDASVAIKWAVEEIGSDQALAITSLHTFSAPELLIAECANILRKKAARNEITAEHALFATSVVARAGVLLAPTTPLMAPALEIAMSLGHPAYDCFYLATAEREAAPLVTADDRLRAKLAGSRFAVLSLEQAAGL